MVRSIAKWVAAVLVVAGLVGAYLWYTRDTDTMVRIDSPRAGERISSPLMVRGKARGTWFFEASFPVTLTDWDGKIIAEGQAHATSDWMTTDWVPFEATLTFQKPSYGERGFLILKKDNPSGLPQYDDSREIMIFFK